MKLHTLAKIVNVVKSIIRLPRKGITRFKAMHNFLINDPPLASVCGFKGHVPDRTTLARRFKALYAFVKEQIQHTGNVLMLKKITTSTMCSVDSTMHKACGNIWHRKHKKINFIPPRFISPPFGFSLLYFREGFLKFQLILA